MFDAISGQSCSTQELERAAWARVQQPKRWLQWRRANASGFRLEAWAFLRAITESGSRPPTEN